MACHVFLALSKKDCNMLEPNDDRGGKIDSDTPKINEVKPSAIKKDIVNNFMLSGVNLDKVKFVITIGGKPVANTVVTATSIKFDYTVLPEQADATELQLLVKDEKNKEYSSPKLKVS